MNLPTERLRLALALYAARRYAPLIVDGAKPWAYVIDGAVVLGIYSYLTALAPGARK